MVRNRISVVQSFLVWVSFASVLAPLWIAAAPANVTTWRNDGARSGLNSNEIILSPDNVNSTDFRKLFQIDIDGIVMAQPLFVSGLSIPGKGILNVVFIATEHDSVYACDADNGAVLWHAVLLKAGETPSTDHGCTGISLPEVGITATPVINNNAIYIQAMSKDSGGKDIQRLHALDVTTGVELFGGPIDIAATYPGLGYEGVPGMSIFDASLHLDRAGLVLANGVIYTTWSSFCDAGAYNSWVIGYDLSLRQAAVLNVVPNSGGGGIWQAGAAPAVDANGSLFVITGNGGLDNTFDGQGFPTLKDYGNCFIKVSMVNDAPQVTDYFSPYNTADETANDQDLGSGGVLLLPDLTDATGHVRHLTVGGGKDRHIYIADRDTMGKFVPNSTDNNNIYQDVPSSALGGPSFSTPLYFNSKLYTGAANDSLKAFQFTDARLGNQAISQSAAIFNFPGTIPSLSANGGTNAILWAIRRAPATLFAYDPQDLSHQLYSSADAANNRDALGVTNKFCVPTIANGKVYAAAGQAVAVYGLINPPRLGNIATRANIGTGENVLIAGFIVQGSAPRKLVLRGIGPSLGGNGSLASGALQDPVLELYDHSGTIIMTNDNWGDSPQKSEIVAAQLAPTNSAESAILSTLDPGSYTVIVRGVSNSTGVGLVELYDISAAQDSTLANLSSRGFVGTGDDVLIGGVIAVGVAPQRVIVRAIGPDLSASGVAGALPDPVLELHDSNGVLIAVNDNWRTDQQS